ncbi:MAG: hypothetical protein QM503_04400 [Bacteroidota bacterium]
MRKAILFFLITVFLGLFNPTIAQEENSISKARKDNLIELLNYRYKGGYYTFEKVFKQTVEYPPMAIGNCIMGIAIISFRVNCEGEVYDIKNKTPLGFGIDREISAFFAKTNGQWNTCRDDKYTKFEIPIQFKLKGTETNNDDALLVLEADNPGYLCNDDEYYIAKMEKYLEKGKDRKALQYIEIMVRRDPYNSRYQDLRKKLLGIE